MKKYISLIAILIIMSFVLIACSDNNEQNKIDDNSEDSHTEDKKNSDSTLSGYSSEEIGYARVWLQLGENQDIDELYAEKISAGEALNRDDETSIDYPKDVFHLSGTRLVDGVVTYSSNGDGTINVYDVPKRWDGKNLASEDVYKKIIDNTEHVSIDPDDDKKVEKLIKKLEIN